MSVNIIPYQIVLDATGGAISLPVGNIITGVGLYPSYIITSSTSPLVLNGSWTIAPTGTPVIGTTFVIKNETVIDLNGKSITVFGRVLLQQEVNKPCIITAKCVSTGPAVWLVDVVMSDNAAMDGKIRTTASDASPGYLEDKIQNSIVINPGTGNAELDGDVLAPGNLFYYGTDASGNKGFFPFPLNYVLDTGWVKIPSAKILAAPATPGGALCDGLNILLHPGSNRYNSSLKVFAFNDFGSSAYDCGTDTLDIQYEDGTPICSFTNAFMESATDRNDEIPVATITDIPLNLNIQAKTANAATLGDGDWYIRIIYNLVQLP